MSKSNQISPNLLAFNFTMRTVNSCENLLHLEGSRNMVDAYGRLHGQDRKTAERYQQLLGAIKSKKEQLKSVTA